MFIRSSVALLAGSLCAFGISQIASAQSDLNPSVTFGLGSEGVSVGGKAWLSPRIATRLEGSYARLPLSQRDDFGEWDGDLLMGSGKAIVELYPRADHGLFLSAGAQLQDHRLTAEQKMTSELVTIGGQTFDNSNLDAFIYEATFQNIAPRLSIGYDSRSDAQSGLSFTGEVGFIYRGDPTVTYSAQNVAPQTASSVNAALAKMAADASPALATPFWPVLNIGGRWRF